MIVGESTNVVLVPHVGEKLSPQRSLPTAGVPRSTTAYYQPRERTAGPVNEVLAARIKRIHQEKPACGVRGVWGRLRYGEGILSALSSTKDYKRSEDGVIALDQTRANNQNNQLVQIDGSSEGIEYDRAGNAIKTRPGAGGDWAKHYQPVWDAWNRLVEVKDENGVTVQKNAYDGLTRRITKESGGVVTHIYWSNRWKPLEERIGSSTTAARSYLWGERPGHRDELVLRDRDTDGNGTLDERLYATMDYFYGTAILNSSGVVQERYAYSAFGIRRIMAGDFSPRSTSSYAWEFGYKGQFRDAETGYLNWGYRYYVPLLGRWIKRDPVQEYGGYNLYGFVFNSAPNWNDQLGADPSKNPSGSAPVINDKSQKSNGGLGPKSPFQSPGSNCAGLNVFPQTTKGNAGRGMTQFNPSPDNMTNPTGQMNPDGTPGAGCRKVGGAGDCKSEKPDCERHVVVYLPEGEGWEDGNIPDYHTIGQSTCGYGHYYHQTGNQGTVYGPMETPDGAAETYFDMKNGNGSAGNLQETHYCCPNDQ